MTNTELTLIKNGKIVILDKILEGDLLIRGEKIFDIGPNLGEKHGLPSHNQNQHHLKIIDAKKNYVLPGGIDVHTHMELPLSNLGISSSDDFSSGTIAALYGGTTTIIDFANQDRSLSEPLEETFNKWRLKADKKVYCDYGLHLTVTIVNNNTQKEIKRAIQEFGVTSFKTFLAYPSMRIDESSMLKLMKFVHDFNGLITVHAENGALIESTTTDLLKNHHHSPAAHPKAHPIEAEVEAIEMMVRLQKQTNCKTYIVHLSSTKGLRAGASSKLLFETCPQYLLLDEDPYYKTSFHEGAKITMSPPLRKRSEQQGLWDGLANGLIQVVATDHCPFTLSQKNIGLNDFTKIPNGIPGVENRMELLYTYGVGVGTPTPPLTVNQFVNVISTNPAKIFGLYPQKGLLAVGSDADVVIFDPNYPSTISAATHHMNCDYNPFEGTKLIGKCTHVFLRGQHLICDQEFIQPAANSGRYLKRSSPLI